MPFVWSKKVSKRFTNKNSQIPGFIDKYPDITVHLVLYSHGEPFDTTKKLTIDTVRNFTSKQIIIHDYSFDKIQKCDWFERIKTLPSVFREGRRDGYYCAYKAFCPWDVYRQMKDGDILYYVDSSQHYKVGFTENIDKLVNIAYEKGFIAGSVGDDTLNNSFGCLDNLHVWNKVLGLNVDPFVLNKRHILASWFIMQKNSKNTLFIDEWLHWCMYTDEEFKDPLITQHHTVDQSIFNILVHKFKLLVFYKKNITHSENKNKNRILNVVNNSTDIDNYFIHV